jgi:hypothetical protein
MNQRTKNFPRRVLLATFLLLAFACSARPIDSDCEACEPFTMLPGVGECREGRCTPTIFECFDRMEFDTCTAACESVRSACAANACAGATYLLHDTIENCMDPSKEGALLGHPCDEPIEWQGHTGAQCCCEQP